LRLPAVAKPTRHEVDLTVDPASQDFSGTITMLIDVAQPTTLLWLNATDIQIDSAVIDTGGAKLAARAVDGGRNFVGFLFGREVKPGPATLTIKYRGKMQKADGQGLYNAQERGDWYAYTQFEATDARKAFPCFDEPSYKAPWRLTLHVKKSLVAVANTPIEGETDEANGMKAVKFAVTKPLPSYLVAFAVGPFEFVDGGKTKSNVPIRIVVPKGRSADAAWPAEASRPILEKLEDYFGMPYPYPKLDMLAVAVFNAGAMENPGLITYRQELILTNPGEMTLRKQQAYAEVSAHEMAHQWFGDYVTLAWWDDTWLNEAFATWMEGKVIAKWKPEWDAEIEQVSTKSGAMGADSLDSARQVRQPIESTNDIQNAFDGITYRKGMSVLAMIERAVGEDVFRTGVRAYMAAHAFGNATYADFVDAIGKAAGHDVHPLFDSFILQSGVPLVSFELSCNGAPKLQLAQERYKPLGSEIDPKRTWHVPICVRWGVGGDTGHDCGQLDEATGELALSAKTCPEWVFPNEAGVGYYRMRPKKDLLDKLLGSLGKLSLAERVGLVGDVNALVASGEVKKGVALELVEKLAKDQSRHIVDASIDIVASIDELVPDAQRPRYERFIAKSYRARAVELGWQTRKGDSDDTKQLRPHVLALVAGAGNDPELVKQGTELAWKWLDDHKAVDPEMVGTILAVAARHGDQKLFDRLHADAKKETDREERGKLLAAMGAFSDPEIAKQAIAVTVKDDFDLREAAAIIQGTLREPKTRLTAYDYIKAHFDEIAAKLPAMYRAYMAFTIIAVCDESKRADAESFFRPRIEKFDGGPRVMKQALEQLGLCATMKKAQTPGVVAFLERQ
jgi:alanyl aminopeptidase